MYALISILLLALLSTVNAVDTNSGVTGAEFNMNNLNLKHIIGAPLNAAVTAQAQAAATSINFINRVGFYTDSAGVKHVINAEFVYRGQEPNGSIAMKRMSVPFLYLVPVPYIQIESMHLEFSMSLSSVATTATSADLNVSARLNTSIGRNVSFLPTPIELSGSVSLSQHTDTNIEVRRSYGLKVTVDAAQSSTMPGGMNAVFALFEKIIKADLPPIA